MSEAVTIISTRTEDLEAGTRTAMSCGTAKANITFAI